MCGYQVIICDVYHGEPNQRWTFHKITDDHPPSYTKQIHIGPVPPGLYWLGQPSEAHKSADKQAIPPGQAPSTAALGATARIPLGDEDKAYAHLSAIAGGPWLHQIWALEPGRRGYRLRNVGMDAYLNYIETEPVLESASVSSGLFSVTEWSLAVYKGRSSKDLPDWLVRPCADHNVSIGVEKGYLFNKLQAKTLNTWIEEGRKGSVSFRWRFEAVHERLLDTSFSTAAADELLKRPHV
ncbi:hypothetical protein FRC03_000820 [Tulasnella sp. 419]|nr:hypothetical protein FRC03_000820 [Tulasnella sp. 419]